MSHDLRTPLAALHGYLETLKLKSQDFDETTKAEYLDTALKHSWRLTKLVEELFELANLDACETKLQCEPFAPAELIQDVIQKFQLTADKSNIDLSMRMHDTLPFVEADIGLIERVLENLISNALRYTPSGGWINISLQPQAPGVLIQVEDNGSGIANQDLPRIFERFYRGNNKGRSDYHAGLGLAIAQHIIMLHGGKIQVESEPGQGTRFYFVLPAWEQT